MAEGIVDMGDMGVIFSVTDAFAIDRESIRVELAKEDPGSVGRTAKGMVEITVPESETVEKFALRLRAELKAMGYAPQQVEDDGQEEEWP